jgi:hypothetical protein
MRFIFDVVTFRQLQGWSTSAPIKPSSFVIALPHATTSNRRTMLPIGTLLRHADEIL